MKKIMFITAPFHTGGVQMAGKWPPIYFAYMAGEAREEGLDVEIYDAMRLYHSYDKIEEHIKSARPDYVMTMDYMPVTGTLSTASVPASLKVLDIAKKLDSSVVTIMSGTHPTFMYEEMLTTEPALDIVIIGEGERVLRNLLKTNLTDGLAEIRGIAYRDGDKIALNEKDGRIEDLDSLKPAWDILDWDKYVYHVDPPGGRLASILSSRGCDKECTFCSQRAFWEQEWRGRDPEKVVDEIAYLHKTYDINVFTFIDAYPTKDRDRWEKILDLIIERDLKVYFLIETRADDIIRDKDIISKYKKAGIIHVYIGAESADKDLLGKINKGITIEQVREALDLLKEAGMITEASFMVGFPEETKESIDKIIESAKDINPDVAVFPIFTPWPYTDAYEDAKDYIKVSDYSKFDILTPVVEPINMTLKEVDEAVGKCYQEFYSKKIKEILALDDEFKKGYLLSAFKLMMKDFKSTFKDKDIEMKHPIGDEVIDIRDKSQENDAEKKCPIRKLMSR